MGITPSASMNFSVNSLSPNTTYYFKVRGGNGCATGAWSNEISATTNGFLSVNQLVTTESQLQTNNENVIVPTIPTSPNITALQEAIKHEAGYMVKGKVTDDTK